LIRDSKNLGPMSMAVLLHIVIFGSMVVAFDYARPAPFTPLVVQAHLVVEEFAGQPPPKEPEPEPEPEPVMEEPEPIIEAPEPEPDNSEELRRQAEEEKRRQDALLEQQRLDELRKKEEAERKQRERDEAERKKREEEEKERKRVEAERKRQEDIQRQREENARKERELEEQFRAKQIEDEERRLAKRGSPAMAVYEATIRQKIQRNWSVPASMGEDVVCIVHVRQVPGGEVIGVNILSCNGDDAVRRSIEAAIYKASPLPEPSDPELFVRDLELTMRPVSEY
jgi:colicin import membrane protein